MPLCAGRTAPPHACLSRQNDGRLRLSRQGVIFKNSKTGKVDNIQASELAEGVWRRVALGHGLKLLTKNGHVYKYDGFRESVSPPAPVCLAPPCSWLASLLFLARACPVSSGAPCESHSTDPPKNSCDPPFSCRFPYAGGSASQLRALGSACLYVVVSDSRSLLLLPAQEFDKLSDFFKAHYRLELAEKDLCVKGWNWGTVRFGGESP